MRRWRRPTSTKSGSRLAAHTAAKWPIGPDGEADQPEAQAEADGAGERAVEDGDGARRAAEQDRLGQRPVDRDGEARHVVALIDAPAIRPAPRRRTRRTTGRSWRANAIDRPNTIWISRRKPPDVSPKASVRPVVMMMMTAMILATGPSID
jgi:hypothetical protein